MTRIPQITCTFLVMTVWLFCSKRVLDALRMQACAGVANVGQVPRMACVWQWHARLVVGRLATSVSYICKLAGLSSDVAAWLCLQICCCGLPRRRLLICHVRVSCLPHPSACLCLCLCLHVGRLSLLVGVPSDPRVHQLAPLLSMLSLCVSTSVFVLTAGC